MDVGVGELADTGRLVEAGGQLGQQFRGPDADGAGDAVGVVDLLLRAQGDGARRPEQPPAAGDVQISLVDGGHLDEIGVLAEQLDEVAVHGHVGLHVDGEEHAPRAEALGLEDGHGAVHAEGARLVRTRGDDTAAAVLAADDHRQAAQLGAPRLLDRSEEGVHIEVQDCPVGYEHTFVSYPRTRRLVNRARRTERRAQRYLLRRPTSTVYIHDPEAPWNVPETAPTPTSRQRRPRMTERWYADLIQALTTACGVPTEPMPQPITSETAQERQPLVA